MSKRTDVQPANTVHVVTDHNGRIIGAMRPSPPDSQVQIRVEPLDGHRCIEVALPAEIPSLQTAEDFQTLVERFHVPPGRTALAPRVIATKRASGEKKGRQSKRRVRR